MLKAVKLCAPCLQLTQTKSKMNFSTIDQVVQTFNRESGKKEALSYRCGDMQRLVPQLMGVSKASFH